MRFLALLCVTFTPLSLLAAAFPLHAIQVTGNKRYSSEAIAKTAGLIVSKPYEDSAFAAASNAIGSTGLFQSVRYRYEPVTVKNQPGFRLIFEVAEGPTVDVVIDIAGEQPDAFWKKMTEANGLIVREMGDGAQAQAYYESEISRILGRKVAIRLDSDLKTGGTLALLQLEDAPLISGVKFTGESAVPQEMLAEATRALPGLKYSPFMIRKAAEASLRELFDNRGLLKAEITVKDQPAAPGVPEIAIQQGAIYRLRKADLRINGKESPELLKIAAFPAGAVAEWDKIESAKARVLKELSREGYLRPYAPLKREFDSAQPEVDLMLDVVKGSQFLFGKLTLEGVTDKQDAALRKRWTLAPGAPFNEVYAQQFVRDIANEVDAASIASGVNPEGLSVEFIVKIRAKP